MKPALLLVSILMGLLGPIAAAAVESGARGSAGACGETVLDHFEIPPKGHADRERAEQALLREIDFAYADLLAAESKRVGLERSKQTQCQLDLYRSRAAELEPIRRATRLAFERAASELQAEEQIGSSLCLPYEFGSSDWKGCERAAAAHRARLGGRLRAAKRAWDRIGEPPDYASEEGREYWITPQAFRARFETLGRGDQSIEPRHLGPEVWCGTTNLRRAETLLAPASEFLRVTEAMESATRNLRNYEERYAQAFAIEHDALEELDEPIRARAAHERLEKLEGIRTALEGWRCQANWNRARARELSDVPNAAEIAYRDARDAFERLETQCDAHRPRDQAWVLAGADSEAWIGCLRAMESERDEKRYTLEVKKSLHEATREAASEYARHAVR